MHNPSVNKQSSYREQIARNTLTASYPQVTFGVSTLPSQNTRYPATVTFQKELSLSVPNPAIKSSTEAVNPPPAAASPWYTGAENDPLSVGSFPTLSFQVPGSHKYIQPADKVTAVTGAPIPTDFPFDSSAAAVFFSRASNYIPEESADNKKWVNKDLTDCLASGAWWKPHALVRWALRHRRDERTGVKAVLVNHQDIPSVYS